QRPHCPASHFRLSRYTFPFTWQYSAAPSRRIRGSDGWRSKTAATRAHTVLELLALLGRHPLPALVHAPSKFGAITTAAPAKAAEQNPAQSQQSESLPAGDLLPSEQRRRQPVPQLLYNFAANHDEKHEHRWGHKIDPFLSHVGFLNSS